MSSLAHYHDKGGNKGEYQMEALYHCVDLVGSLPLHSIAFHLPVLSRNCSLPLSVGIPLGLSPLP